ncbi:MAG: penicillin-binding transpeptidase domain-containing protein [Oscillospiraceae bacterium]|nr:penicillin-binding transpeptidase domain-containing protein [Oscillospiraceae bacterium]
MKPITLWIRRIVIVLLVLGVLMAYVGRLMQIQIVDAEIFRAMLADRKVDTQPVKAVRGEIVDADGNLLAANRMGYDVIIDYAFFPRRFEQQNEILLELILLFEQSGESRNDSLPISRFPPFSFESGRDDDIARVKSFTGTQEYASADDAMHWLTGRYRLNQYTPASARKIAGVRYTMEQRGFNLRTPYTFASDIDIATVVKIKERSFELAGVDVTEVASRYYPVHDMAPHLLGTIGPIFPEESRELLEKGYALNDLVGRGGVEGAMESFLRGTDGVREILTDSSGNVIEARESVSPIPGSTIKLTISPRFQYTAQEMLEAQIAFLNENAPEGQGKEADAGAVVMLEVKTGKLLAAATFPSYDLTAYNEDYTLLTGDSMRPLFNRALGGLYAPGSTFKPSVALAGVGNNFIGEGASVNCTHTYGPYPQFRCLGSHGPISLLRAMAQSCNIYFYDLGLRTGIDTIDAMTKSLGLGEPTGIEVPESIGHRSNPETKRALRGEDWYPGDTIQSSIGQLFHSFTPLQMANYAATIANKGERMKLTLIEEILDYTGSNVTRPFAPVVAEKIENIDPMAFDSVIRSMVAASRTGSAQGTFGNYPLDVASKTGTPETFGLPNSTFISFAPADDPEVAIVVIIEKGWHGYTGAPVAKALFDEYFGIEIDAWVDSGPQQLRNERAAPGFRIED